MKIVFVRHAKAIDADRNTPDVSRALTAKGKKQFAALLPAVTSLCSQETMPVLWTSPALRTRQTADILAAAFPGLGSDIQPSLYSGDFDAFVQALDWLSADTCLFVVGHEPYLSEWSRRLLGERIEFKKGSLAALAVEDPHSQRGTLLWQMAADGSLEQVKTTDAALRVCDIRAVMLNLLREIKDKKELFLESPADPETVHRLRVSIRQLRSLLSFFKPLLPAKACHKYQEELKTTGSRFGFIRELDVLLEEWLAFTGAEPGLQGRRALIALLSKKRAAEQAALWEYAASGSIDSVVESCWGWLENQDFQAKAMQHRTCESFAAERFEALNETADTALRDLTFRDFAKIHRARITYKKLRYVQSNLPMLEAGKIRETYELKELQDDLGRICDTYVNIRLLETLAGEEQDGGLNREISLFIEHLLDVRRSIEAKLSNPA